MFEVQGKLIHLDLIESRFVCDLSACKGACCVAGDLGAPLEQVEIDLLNADYDQIAPYLTDAGREVIANQGIHIADSEGDLSTPLIEGGPCAYIKYNENGVAQCGIEAAWADGKTTFRKPISCHLYPIRVFDNQMGTFEALNYDRWDICDAACSLGEKLEIPIYAFLKESLIRKYGPDFYTELDEIAQAWLTREK
jgi:Protein of unknown function (DUF3109)